MANNLKRIYIMVAYDLQLSNKTCKYAKIRPLFITTFHLIDKVEVYFMNIQCFNHFVSALLLMGLYMKLMVMKLMFNIMDFKIKLI